MTHPDSAACFCPRPVRRGSRILLGNDDVLMERRVERGFIVPRWHSPAALSKLFTLALGVPVGPAHPIFDQLRRIDDAWCKGLLTQLDRLLAEFPLPPLESGQADRLSAGLRLLEKGVAVADLHKRLQLEPLTLPPEGGFKSNLVLSEAGLELGGQVLAPLVIDAAGAPGLDLAGREDAVVTLIAAALDRPAAPGVILQKIAQSVSSLQAGDGASAQWHLASIGIWPPLQPADHRAAQLSWATQAAQHGWGWAKIALFLRRSGLVQRGLPVAGSCDQRKE